MHTYIIIILLINVSVVSDSVTARSQIVYKILLNCSNYNHGLFCDFILSWRTNKPCLSLQMKYVLPSLVPLCFPNMVTITWNSLITP